MPDLAKHHHKQLQALERLAHRMDRAFRIPLIGVRIGWDSIAGLVPGVGDTIALIPAGYILYSGYRMGASAPILARMAANIGVDALIGSIPLAGDLFDVAWKANTRNTDLLRRHFEERAASDEPLPKRLGRKRFSSLTAPRELRLAPTYVGAHHPGALHRRKPHKQASWQHPLNRTLDS
ncbi:DUF4112 domain-containing protein [Leisingera daeponensis]|uniref:DUF4112 domain-containing protein n=1 Tax=Leisingera daeponensis TaxID=405746 RepID=A0ABS7NA57_9RHOB|nr:DUF4112 domain-containing protein [Leisingera daeponensis]MBY6138080.1 DUF4112 domain-containing protein [Leisingera daeponensis]